MEARQAPASEYSDLDESRERLEIEGWQRRVQGATPTPSATNLSQASMDAIRTILRDLFAG